MKNIGKLWSETSIGNVQSLIDYLLKNFRDGGWTLNLQNEFAFSELQNSFLSDVAHSDIVKVLSRMKSKDEQTINDFKKHFIELQRENVKNSRLLSKWSYFLPLKIKFDKEINLPATFTINKIKFTIKSRIPGKKQIPDGPWDHLYSFQEEIRSFYNNKDFYWLVIDYDSNEWAKGWKELGPSLDIFTGLFEFTFGFKSTRIASFESPRCKLPAPAWVIILKNNKFFTTAKFAVDLYEPKKWFTIKKKEFLVFRKNIKLFVKQLVPNSTLFLIADSLRLYRQAMEAQFSYNAFLHFWQVLETITLAESFGGDYKKVIARVNWKANYYGFKYSGFGNTLKKFSELRNKLVHRGIYNEIKQDEVNLLKVIVDYSLLWLFQNRKRLPTITHLEEFYRIKDFSKPRLKQHKEVLKLVQKDL